MADVSILNGYNIKDAAARASIAALGDDKVEKEIVSANGVSQIFNEADGGGAKFTHVDGTASFVGVNDGGEDGIDAQIYAAKFVDGKWNGARLDVTLDGIYYTVGDKPASERLVSGNEIITRKDLQGGIHYIGKTTLAAGETIAQAIARLLDEKSHVAQPGDIVIIETQDGAYEYIYDGTTWQELGSEGAYATKAQLQAEVSRAQTEEAKKVDKEINGTVGKSLIFNESDGGGSKFDGNNGVKAYVGTHNNIGGEIGTQIYVDKANGTDSTIIDVTQNGAYYTKGTVVPGAQRDVAANEIAVQHDINTDNLAQGVNTFVIYGGSATDLI